MKKLLCVFLIIVMIFSFSGCFSMLSDVADEVKEPSNVEADTDENTENFNRLCNIASEYGSLQKVLPSTPAYLEEHCDVIIAEDALKVLSLV